MFSDALRQLDKNTELYMIEELEQKIKSEKQRADYLQSENSSLQSENSSLQNENQSLLKEIEKLKQQLQNS